MKFFIIVCCLICTFAVQIGVSAQVLFSDEALFSEEATAINYNVELSLQPEATADKNSGVQLALEWQNVTSNITLTFTRSRTTIVSMVDGKIIERQAVATELTADNDNLLTVLRRGSWLGIIQQQQLIFAGEFARGNGERASLKAGAGWAVAQQELQPLEAVFFTDDFMRVENDQWGAQAGNWLLANAWQHDVKSQVMRMVDPGAAQNPFAMVGSMMGNTPAWSTALAGKNSWDDYRFSAAIQPSANGAVGLLCNMDDTGHGLLLRWSQAGERGDEGNLLALYQFDNGKRTLLTKSTGGAIPGQWFKLTIVSSLREGVQVEVDGEQRLTLVHPPSIRGGVGLYSESNSGTIFDDITVVGHALDADVLADILLARVNSRFQNDIEMSAWSKTQSEWQPMPGVNNQWRHRFDFYGDQWIIASLTPVRLMLSQLQLILCGDGVTATAGYRAQISRSTEGEIKCAIFRNEENLAETVGLDLTNGEKYDFEFRRSGNQLILQCDGEIILEAADAQPLNGLRPSYRAEGGFSTVREVLVTGKQVLDYTFNSAPVDWIGDGHWLSTIRWSCAPQWSFLGGWSRGDAVLWHKKIFTGDQTFQAYMGVKMEYPRQEQIYEDRFRGLAVTICGDGKNPRNGYAVIFGAPDLQGNPNRRTILLRNGVEVASTPQAMPQKTYGHHTWFDMVLQKRGAEISFSVKYLSKNMWWWGDPGREVTVTLNYTDPQPLAGGTPAIWSADNGITIARSRIFFQQPPQSRQQPLVSISDPWYPEWTNLGTTLKLDFADPWSTAGNEAQFKIVPGKVPVGEEGQAIFEGDQLRFTPRQRADYWYSIFSEEGDSRSGSVHLSLPVFNPELGRDDSHAVVLYRFDEGSGDRIHDLSAIAPAADLLIPKEATTNWLPARGLHFIGPQPIQSENGVGKLATIAKSNAFTIELWLSPDTNDPPTSSIGNLISWGEGEGNKRNLVFQHRWYNVLLIGNGTYYVQNTQKWHGPVFNSNWREFQFYLGLQHVVITWDGITGRTFFDGKERTGLSELTGLLADLNPEGRLLLGNSRAKDANYLGSYYLAAIHDRCFNPEEVLRHFNAGPDAK